MYAQRTDGTQEQPENRVDNRGVHKENTRQRFGRDTAVALRPGYTDQVGQR